MAFFATILAALRSVLFVLVFYIGSVPIVVGGFISSFFWPAGLAAFSQSWGRFHYYCMRWILGIRVEIDGHFRHGPVLYAIKHESMFEAIDVLRVHDRPVTIAKRQLADIPLWNKVAGTYGMIFVDREGGAKALRLMMKAGKAYVAQGRPLLIFPEGSRIAHGETAPLQSGFAGLYRAFGLTVVPVAVDSGKLLSPGKFIRRSGTIHYKVGEPIPPGLPREEIEARVLDAINALNSDDAAHQTGDICADS
jgi:1-acyl-sn-glycerol-3-phosphate acyltransferase